MKRTKTLLTGAALAVLGSACGGDGPPTVFSEGENLECSIPVDDIHRGALRGIIPELTDPELALEGEPGTEYLRQQDRVIGMLLGGQPVAIPLNILWWHEIVNLNVDGYEVAVTHCPLTGSSLAFDRSAVGGVEFGVSGLLYENNLVMYDRSETSESLWPQMARGARCGSKDGTRLPMMPLVELTWEGWRDLHPDSKIVTSNTGHIRNYQEYPYADVVDPTNTYDYIDNAYTLFPVRSGIDRRRLPKERILGIPDDDGAALFPFGELAKLGFTGAVSGSTVTGEYVILWSGIAEGAMAYRPIVNGQRLTLRGAGDRLMDAETSSVWGIDGVAVSGPLAGSALEPIADAFVAFWFAWPSFYPQIDLWTMP